MIGGTGMDHADILHVERQEMKIEIGGPETHSRTRGRNDRRPRYSGSRTRDRRRKNNNYGRVTTLNDTVVLNDL